MNYLNLLQTKHYQSFIIKNTKDVIQNGKDLLKKYSEISAVGLNENNRYVIYLEQGTFDLGSSSLILNKNFVDIIGLNEVDKPIITSNIGVQNNGTINQLVDYISLVNLVVKNTNTSFESPWHTLNLTDEDRLYYDNRLGYLPSTYYLNLAAGQNYGKTYIENVDFISLTHSIQSMRNQVSYGGTYKNVSAGIYSFGFKGRANGNFINCTADSFSFGSYAGEVNGYFENCKASNWSFGSRAVVVNGKFVNCKANQNSFGIEAGTNNGSYINCENDVT